MKPDFIPVIHEQRKRFEWKYPLVGLGLAALCIVGFWLVGR